MDFENALSFPPYPGEFLHPVVYACTSVLLLCMLASIITYVVHQRAIRISRHAWHMLLNLCLYTALTFTVFAGGINRITSPVACRAVGIVLHYCSLCSLLWLGVSARYIYIQVTKEIPQGPDGDPCSPQRPPPSILRCYLVSDGVPLLICVVTAATDMENYGSSDDSPFCWIAWEPSLGAFYGPVALIVLATCIYFLCASVQLRRHPERRYELQIVTEEQRRLSGTASGAGGPSDTPGATLANELSLRSQLRTAAFTLFLFLTTWAFGALAVWLGPVLDMVFSCLYGASCASLGLFLLIQHCAKREDVWQRWWACRSGPRPAPTPPKPSANGDVLGPGCDRPPSTYGRVASSSATQVGRCCMLSPGQKTAEGRAQAGSPPGQVLQSCLKDRTKHHPLSRYTYRVASSSLDGSAHSSYLESPQCTLEVHSCPSHDAYSCHGIRDTLPCSTVHDLEACHGINEGSTCHEGFVCCGTQERHMCDSMREGHGSKRTQEGPVYKCMPEGHVCPSVCEEHRCKCIHEEYTCKCACEEHICNSMHEGRDYQCHPAYPKADPFAIACQGDSEPGSAFYGCRKMANKETLLPLEKDSQNLANHIQPPAFPQTQASQNRSPNVRLKREAAGLWKNETSV